MKKISQRKMEVAWSALVLVAMMLTSTTEEQPESGIALEGCPDRCGDVDVPYPFGIGDSCSLSPAFNLGCNNTNNPAKPFKTDVEVTNITLESGQMRVLMGISYSCYNSSGVAVSSNWWLDLLERSPYTFSYTENVFTAVGCDTWALIQGTKGQVYTGGCISMCESTSNVVNGSCSGIGCCEVSIPRGLRRYEVEIRSSTNHSGVLGFNPCSYGFLVEKENYTFHASDLKSMDKTRRFPIVWDFFMGNQGCEKARNSPDYACVSANSDCSDSGSGTPGYLCNCKQGFHGNPYLNNGCRDINECGDRKTYPCHGMCTNTLGDYDCICPEGTTGDDAKTAECTPVQTAGKVFQAAIVVPVAVISSLLVVALSISIYVLLQKRKLTKLKERYFSQNGGSILQRRISSKEGVAQSFKLFTKEEAEKATNNYDPSQILGRGGQGVVYKGKLPNNDMTFAIKKSLIPDGSKVEEFVNELSILSQINHKNVVKLLGCCLEVENPLLVYEFIQNGTLFQQIHNDSMTWEVRLRIAAETAGALAYLHSSASIPIIHRDVKSTNILLSSDYAAKVSDFGASRLIPVNEMQVTTLVQGTLGYLDPEYLQTHQLTDKSDVYSFGVVLVELLTGMTPLSYERNEEERSLAMYFLSCVKADGLDQLLDPKIVNATVVSQIKEVADMARRCLSLRGEDRPPMVEVAMELEGLRRSMSHPWIPHDAEEIQSLLSEPSTSFLDESSVYSTTAANLDSPCIELSTIFLDEP